MKEHEHTTDHEPAAKPEPGGVAKGASSKHPAHHGDHAHMAADFRKRFWISLVLTLPILALSPMLQSLVGLREAIRFPPEADPTPKREANAATNTMKEASP